MRATSRDIRLNGAKRKDRVHLGASGFVHREGRLDASWDIESEDRHQILLPETETDARTDRERQEREGRKGEESKHGRPSARKGRRCHGLEATLLRTANYISQAGRQVFRRMQTLPTGSRHRISRRESRTAPRSKPTPHKPPTTQPIPL